MKSSAKDENLIPKSRKDVETIILNLKPEDLAFTIDMGSLSYMVWRFRWKSSTQDTIILRLPKDPNGELEVTDFMMGIPNEITVRTRLVRIAPE